MAQRRGRHFDDFRQPKKVEEGGVIRISGSFLLDHEEEIISLLKHQSQLAEEKNASHRLINIEKSDSGIMATFSDHNLTLHVGKMLTHAYKGKHDYKFLKGEKFVEVDWRRD